MMMFPLFTVYITNWVQRYNRRHNPSLFEDEFTDSKDEKDGTDNNTDAVQ